MAAFFRRACRCRDPAELAKWLTYRSTGCHRRSHRVCAKSDRTRSTTSLRSSPPQSLLAAWFAAQMKKKWAMRQFQRCASDIPASLREKSRRKVHPLSICAIVSSRYGQRTTKGAPMMRLLDHSHEHHSYAQALGCDPSEPPRPPRPLPQ